MLTANQHNGHKFAYLVVCFFGFLGPEVLVIASTICYAWGKLVHDRSLSCFKPMITSEFEEIDLFGSNNMYMRIPLSVLEGITSLFSNSTDIKRKHLLQIFKLSKLPHLNV